MTGGEPPFIATYLSKFYTIPVKMCCWMVRTRKAAAAVLKLNIKEEYRDDAISLAENLVNGECDFTQVLNNVIAKYPQFITTTTPKLNLGGSTQGMIHNTQKNRDAFVSGIKNDFLGD